MQHSLYGSIKKIQTPKKIVLLSLKNLQIFEFLDLTSQDQFVLVQDA